MPNRQQRIVIIGAGAAGLTAAETLKQKGYTNITILERAMSAGGKCCSLEYESRFYELGACILSAANRTALSLAKRYNVPIAKVEFGDNTLIDIATGKPIAKKTWLQNLKLKYKMAFPYRRLLNQYMRVKAPGHAGMAAELSMPFTHWAKRHGLEVVVEELAPFFTGYGYGYFDEIPAAYVLKYYSWETIKAFVAHKMYKLPGGIQHLWTEVAKHHHVLYGSVIKQIKRDQVISIDTETETIECDALIVTSPLDEFIQLTEPSPEEKTLFERIQYYDYRTYALFLKNFSKSVGYFPGNYTASRVGQPVFWYRRYADSNLFTFYAFSDGKMTDEQILKNITQAIEQIGGSVESVHTTRQWKFFPHITAAEMQSGYFDRLEDLQGERRTYYAGEVMNFSTVGLTAEYAESLVHKFF